MISKEEKNNEKTIDYFKKIERNLVEMPKETDNLLADKFKDGRIQLSKTDKEARMNGRIDAMVNNQKFNEKDTPPEELVNLKKELPIFMIERLVKETFKD